MANESGMGVIDQNAMQNVIIEENSAEQYKKMMVAIRNYQAIYDKSYPEYIN